MSPVNPQSEAPSLDAVQARLRALVAAGTPYQRIADAGVGLSWATVRSYAESAKARPQARVLAQLWAAMEALSQSEGNTPHTEAAMRPNPSKPAGAFGSEDERRGYLRRILEEAARAIAEARGALDAPLTFPTDAETARMREVMRGAPDDAGSRDHPEPLQRRARAGG